MRVGLYYDFSFAGEGSWLELREQARAADELGFDSLWYAERAFRNGAPGALHILVGNLATSTRAARIGGFQVLPLANPVRVAEDWAVADLLSGGRVNVGAARGEDRASFRAYRRDWKTRERVLWETVDFVRHAWTSDELQYLGRDVRFPAHLPKRVKGNAYARRRQRGRYVPQWERGPAVPEHLAVTPKPLQEPHPPLWIFGAEGAMVRAAATRGLSCVLPPAWPAQRVDAAAKSFHSALAKGGRRAFEVELGVARDIALGGTPVSGQSRGACLSGAPEKIVDGLKQLQNETGFNHLLWRLPYPALGHREILVALRRFAAEVQPMLQS